MNKQTHTQTIEIRTKINILWDVMTLLEKSYDLLDSYEELTVDLISIKKSTSNSLSFIQKELDKLAMSI